MDAAKVEIKAKSITLRAFILSNILIKINENLEKKNEKIIRHQC